MNIQYAKLHASLWAPKVGTIGATLVASTQAKPTKVSSMTFADGVLTVEVVDNGKKLKDTMLITAPNIETMKPADEVRS